MLKANDNKQISIKDKQGKETQFFVDKDKLSVYRALAEQWGCEFKIIGEDKTR